MTKIMLVEDDKSLREIYGVRLLAEGYDIKSAGDGEEALAMAVKEHPDLILSDVMMPKISGFDMLDILRATPETREIKVIMMTALSSEDQRMRGESLGANRYLVKSQVGIEDVVRAVHEVLGDTPAQQKAQAPAPNLTAQMSPNMARPASASPTAPTAIPRPVQPITQPAQPTSMPNRTPQQSFTRPTQQTPRPQTPTQPAQPFQPKPQQLPQPTAPFSTPAPASLAGNFTTPNAANASPSNITQTTTRPQTAPTTASSFAPNPVVTNPSSVATTIPAPVQQPTSASPAPASNSTPSSTTFTPYNHEQSNSLRPETTYKPKAGSTVINPIPSTSNTNISDLINQELNNFNQAQQTPSQNSTNSPNPTQFRP